MVEYQWFLTSLSERPGSCFEMFAHLFPWCSCMAIKIASSSSVHSPFLSSGSRWLTNLSLHCFPWRPGKCAAIFAHFRPYCRLFSLKMASSSAVQDPFPLMTGGLVIVCHFVRQSMAVLFEKFAAISFQRGAAAREKQENQIR